MRNKLFIVFACSATLLFCEEKTKEKGEHHLKIYSDIAIVETEEVFQHNHGLYVFSNLPSTLYPESTFVVSSDVDILESKFETTEENAGQSFSLKTTHPKGENATLSLTYATDRITWTPFYTATFSKDCETLDLNGWFEIYNNTETPFKDAIIDVADDSSGLNLKDDELKKTESKNRQQFYKIQGKVDLTPHKKKRIQWISKENVPITKEYRLNVGGKFLTDLTNTDDVPTIELWVNCLNELKILPKGSMILYQKDDTGHNRSLTRISLPLVKLNQNIAFKMPDSLFENNQPPLKIAYEQTEFQRFTGKIVETANRITVQNTSDETIVLKIFGDFPTKDGVILRESMAHQGESDQNFYWTLEIGPKEKTELRYRLRFSQES